MASNRDNIIFEKTSFLQGSNSPFIKELYLQYLKNPTIVPQTFGIRMDFYDDVGGNGNYVFSLTVALFLSFTICSTRMFSWICFPNHFSTLWRIGRNY